MADIDAAARIAKSQALLARLGAQQAGGAPAGAPAPAFGGAGGFAGAPAPAYSGGGGAPYGSGGGGAYGYVLALLFLRSAYARVARSSHLCVP
jgi:hypothetical protein